jgi:hypothetical protein
VYLGRTTGVSTSPTFALRGTSVGDRFGSRVASAGDVNGDGFGDLVVAASGADGNAGRVYVFYGGAAGISATPSVMIAGPAGASGSFGDHVATIGDVDGDGFADLAVGASGVGSQTGRVYVFRGASSGLTTTASWTFDGPDGAGSSFGLAIARGADVNADGFGDLVVSAMLANGGTGAAYVFAGSASGPASAPSLRIAGFDGTGGQFGSSLEIVGDVDGDGIVDVGVGADNPSATGRAYVFLGSTSGLTATPSTSLAAPDGPSTRFGIAVAGDDFNGDGFADVAVGASSAAGPDSVRVYASAGASGIPSTATQTLNAVDSPPGSFGSVVAAGGDVNGDPFRDLLVAAPDAAASTGHVFLFDGATSGLPSSPTTTLVGPDAANGRFGTWLAL